MNNMRERLIHWSETQSPQLGASMPLLNFHEWNAGMRESLPAPEDAGQGHGNDPISVDEYLGALGFRHSQEHR